MSLWLNGARIELMTGKVADKGDGEQGEVWQFSGRKPDKFAPSRVCPEYPH